MRGRRSSDSLSTENSRSSFSRYPVHINIHRGTIFYNTRQSCVTPSIHAAVNAIQSRQPNASTPSSPPAFRPKIHAPEAPPRRSKPRRSETQNPSYNSYTSPPCPRIPVADPALWRTTCTRLGRPFRLCRRSRAGEECVLAFHQLL